MQEVKTKDQATVTLNSPWILLWCDDLDEIDGDALGDDEERSDTRW